VEPAVSQQPLGTLLGRALRLRCPRCGGDRLFVGLFRMHARCNRCQLKYERAPGYFLGSTYINYGLTALLITVLYVGLHFGLKFSNRALALPLTAVCVVVPMFFFRYARALWLTMDLYFDPTGFTGED
jgi:uncharacterized protein (DUF983 family)